MSSSLRKLFVKESIVQISKKVVFFVGQSYWSPC